MNRRRFVGTLGAGLLGAWASRANVAWALGSAERYVERWSWVMGQAVHVMLFAPSEDAGLEACAAALAELRRIDARLSLFDDASDLCELNRRAGRRPMTVDGDLGQVLRHALAYRDATAGAFDAAIEPLMRAWGFRDARAAAPTPAELAAAREAVAHAEVRLSGNRALLATAHTQLDFGGIAVGFGIDRALAVLRDRGIRRAFVNVSGDCGAIGAPPGASGWRVDITDPGSPTGVLTTVRLRDAALATSSNRVSQRRYGPVVVGHVLDPQTGHAASGRLLQASVLAERAIAADALSTAMLVSGRRPPSPGVIAAYGIPA
ncbi:MAG: FAD:protein FMN transferase [Gemmatimonadales bacterium]